MTRWFTNLSTLLKRTPAIAPTAPSQVAAHRTAAIEWTDADGQVTAQPGRLILAEDGAMTMSVPVPPVGPVARLLEQGTPCPVEILATTPVVGGFELKFRYLREGRRREKRDRVKGQAVLEVDGAGSMSVEVCNVSGGGIQVLSRQPARVGSTVRLNGEEIERVGVVRSCSENSGAYRIGIQFFGENRLFYWVSPSLD